MKNCRFKAVLLATALFAAAWMTLAPAFADTYQYDAQARLIGVTFSNGSSITYTYDGAGNRITVATTP